MSFDLYFCWPKPERINFEEVKAWAEEVECFTRKDTQLWYSNPKTGVYFSFDFASGSPEDGPEIPKGYFDSGLSFNLNYNRPSYFSFEAMPIVAKLASRFALRVVNPQENSKSGSVADSDTLVRSWVKSNERAVLLMMEQPSSPRPLTMPVAHSLYLWRYGKAKEEFERACGASVFVPSLVPVERKGDAKAGRATVYTEGLPTIVPECEWVFLVRRRKGLFHLKEKHEVTAISSETFRELLADCIKPFPGLDLDVHVIAPEFAEKAAKVVRSIERTLPRSDFEVIGTDSFDVELPSAS